MEASVSDYAVLIPVSAMIAALPVSFGGWGVGEAAAVYFFARRGIAEASALVLSTMGRTIQLGLSLIGLPLSLLVPKAGEAPVGDVATQPDADSNS